MQVEPTNSDSAQTSATMRESNLEVQQDSHSFDPRDFGWETSKDVKDFHFKGRDEEKVSLLEGRAPPLKYAAKRESVTKSSPLSEIDPETAGGIVLGICCCLCVLGVLVSGIVLSILGVTKEYSDEARTGFTILGVCAALMVFLCCGCCCACIANGPGEGGPSAGKNPSEKHENSAVPKRPTWVFKRRNDRHTKEKALLSKLYKTTGPKIPPAVEKLLDARSKAVAKRHVEERKKEESELLKWVTDELKNDKTVTATDIRKRMRPTVFVLYFNGDTQASQVTELRDQISLILQVAGKRDEVVVVLTTGGGAVASYGLAAAQLIRVRNAGIRLTVCIDTIAASGGYMIAVCANKILASPFAYVGSIGVVTYIPNIHRALENKDVDVVLATAGKYKRTVDVVGEVTEAGKEKLKEELEAIHRAFKEHVQLFRPQLDIETIATGEAWLAVQAKSKCLIDDIMTSDDYLLERQKVCDVLEFSRYKQKEGIMDFLSSSSGSDVSTHPGVVTGMLGSFLHIAAKFFSTFVSFVSRRSIPQPVVRSSIFASDQSPFDVMAMQQV